MRNPRFVMVVLLAGLGGWLAPAALGWGAEVHRTTTRLALDALPPEAPDWLRSPTSVARVVFQANQVDRWRGSDSLVLKHENDADHYLDAELLDGFGLTLDTVPRLRMEYVRQMAVAKQVHPEKVPPYEAGKDPARVHEWPGFVLHAAAEHYAKLQQALRQVRIIESLRDPRRKEDLEQAQAIALYHLGDLSHFVLDISQPLHTTKHYDGWAGENPEKYVWRERFHAYVDSAWQVDQHADGTAIRPLVSCRAVADAADPWNEVLACFKRSHAQVARLYALERDHKLGDQEGRKVLLDQLADGTSLLSGLIWAAYQSSAPTDDQVQSFVRYDERAP